MLISNGVDKEASKFYNKLSYFFCPIEIMNQVDVDFSTIKITPQLISRIVDALKNKSYGSIEIYVENYNVTQITERTITKLAKRNQSRKISVTVSRNPQFAASAGRGQVE